MDEFQPGQIEYDEAHGLYELRWPRRKQVVVSPGDKIPRWARRIRSLNHPGVARQIIDAGGRVNG